MDAGPASEATAPPPASAAAAVLPEATWSAIGEIQDSDSKDAEGRPYDDHRVSLTAGQRVRISADSEAFDTLLHVLRSGETGSLAENDDAGGGLNSRLSFTPDRSGDYVLRVLGFAQDARGAYTLALRSMPPLPTPISAPTRTEAMTWRVFEGALTAEDPQEENAFDDYLVTARAGETLLIRLDATAQGLDPLVQVFRAEARGDQPIASDDDSAGNLNALLAFVPDQPGDYVVRVTSAGEGSLGAYRLRIGQ